MVCVHVVDNPYVQELLGVLRDRSTPCHVFRRVLREVGYLLGVEASRSLPVERTSVVTPLGARADAVRVDRRGLVVLAIARAGIPLAEGLLRAHPTASMGLAVARRVEEPGRPVDAEVYYVNCPRARVLVVVDPMIATGSTIARVLERVYAMHGRPEKTIIVGVIATRVGIERIGQVEPGAEFYVLAVDPELDERAFIVPGLGDAGDRAYCTEEG